MATEDIRGRLDLKPRLEALAGYLDRIACKGAVDVRDALAEIERLADYDQRLSAVMPADCKDWHQNSRVEWPEVAARMIQLLEAERDALQAECEERAKAEGLLKRERDALQRERDEWKRAAQHHGVRLKADEYEQEIAALRRDRDDARRLIAQSSEIRRECEALMRQLIGQRDDAERQLAEAQAALRRIASCQSHCQGDVVDIARAAVWGAEKGGKQ